MTGIPPLPVYCPNYPRLATSSQNGASNFVLISPVERELCDFFQELNQSSSLGLSRSEVVSLAKGNFVPSLSYHRVEEPPRIPLRLVDIFGDPSGGTTYGNSGLNSILPAAERPHLGQGPSRACKSSKEERTTTTTTGRTLRLHTLSTAAGLKGQFGGKNSKSLVCSHESFPHDDLSTLKSSIGRTSNSRSKSSSSGHQSKCNRNSGASFQCRVIKLSQREHVILQQYEKVTKSIERLNQESTKKHVQVFLLSRSQEVHVSGKDFEFARNNLLKFIRLSQLWWDKGRRKGVACKSTSAKFSNLNVQERLQKKMSVLSKLPSVQRGPKPEDVYSMAEASVDTSTAVQVQLLGEAQPPPVVFLPPPVSKVIDQPLPFPKIIKSAPPRKLIKPPPPPKVIEPPKVTQSPLKECLKKQPPPPEIIKIEDTADISNVQLCGKEAPKQTSVGGAFQLFPHLCSSFPDCANKFSGVFNDCSVVPVQDVFFHGMLVLADQSLNMMEKIRSTLEAQGIGNVKVSLLRKSPVFHVLSQDDKFTKQAMNYLTSLLSRCSCLAHLEKEFDCKPTDTPQVQKTFQFPPLTKVTQPPWKKPIGTSQQRLPQPSKPKPCVKQRAIPVVAKPTPPIKPGMSQAEKRKFHNTVGRHPNSQTPNQQRLRAWKPPKTSDICQRNNNSNNNNFRPHPRNQARMGPPRMPFGHGPHGFGRSPNNNFPWRPQGPPRQNPGQPQQQQYPPFRPPQFPGGNNGYGLWNHGGGNTAHYPQNNNGLWQ